jgi:Diacylglycerol kinase
MDLKDKQQVGKNKRFITSVEFAITGIKTAFKEERNMRSHTILGMLAIIVGLFFHLHPFEWLWIFLSIFLVIVVEMINTAFENVVDMVTEKHFNIYGKKIKDIAAGAVLLTSLFAMIVALIIFLPKVIDLLF